ncbi:MAG: hypothetical protein ABI594_07200 [Ginsengibacter sp.]
MSYYPDHIADSLVSTVTLVIFYKLLCNGIPVNGNLLANLYKSGKGIAYEIRRSTFSISGFMRPAMMP